MVGDAYNDEKYADRFKNSLNVREETGHETGQVKGKSISYCTKQKHS